MKRTLSLAAALILLLSMTGCSLFANKAVVKLGDSLTHTDPQGLTYDQRIVLSSDTYGDSLVRLVNEAAYPDTIVYDEGGNIIGIYDYDPETGLATAITSFADGSYTPLEGDDVVDLGKPDPSSLISLSGDVTLYFVVYGNSGKTLSNYVYLTFSDKTDCDAVRSAAEGILGISLKQDSDTVLSGEYTQEAIAAELQQLEESGYSVGSDAQSYANYLMQSYGVRLYGGVNPYKPFEGAVDPEGLDFDEKVILTGSGDANVDEEYASDISSTTDIIYGKDGQVVAHYTYFECPSKEAADELMGVADQYIFNASRFSDTVIVGAVSGTDMQDLLTAYRGYNVLSDSSVKDYTRMVEETYFSVVWKS